MADSDPAIEGVNGLRAFYIEKVGANPPLGPSEVLQAASGMRIDPKPAMMRALWPSSTPIQFIRAITAGGGPCACPTS